MASKAKKKGKAGRIKYVIDWDKVNSYLRAGCDGSAVARLFGMHPDTLYINVKKKYGMDFSAYAAQKRSEGVSLMEYSIYLDAMKHGGVDRIFWMKNRANWSDKQVVDQNIRFPSLPDIVLKSRVK